MTQNAKPIIAWYNRVLDAIISVSTEDAAYPKENLFDLRPDTFHKGAGSAEQYIRFTLPAAIDVTCVGIVGHDLFTQGASVKLQAYVGAAWVDCIAAWTPANNKAQWKCFAAKNSDQFQLVIPTGYTLPPSIAVVMIGGYTTFPGWPTGDWDPDHEEAQRDESISSEGHYLGTNVKYSERRFNLNFERLLDAFVVSDLKPFFAWAKGKPFFVIPEITNHPTDVFYMLLDKPTFAAPWGAVYRSHSIAVRGLVE